MGVQAFDCRFFTLDEEKVKSLHFFSAFLSQRFVAFYIQRIALGIISVALLSYIVTTTFCLTKIYLTLRPSQQAQEQDQDHQGQRNGAGSDSFNSTLNPFWPVQVEDERYKTSSEGLFQKICFLSN